MNTKTLAPLICTVVFFVATKCAATITGLPQDDITQGALAYFVFIVMLDGRKGDAKS